MPFARAQSQHDRPEPGGSLESKPGSLPSFPRYSPALKSAGIIWTDDTLDEWIKDPQHFIPGNTMTFPGMKDAGNAPICSRFSRMRSLLNFTDRRFWRQVFGHSVSHPADGCSDFASDLCVSADSALLPLNVLTSNLRIRRSNPYRPHGLESYIDCGASVAQLPVGKRAATRGPARVSQGLTEVHERRYFMLSALTIAHVVISLVGIGSGFVVVYGLVAGKRFDFWTALFLMTTVATSVTGFFFPVERFLPSHAIGIVSLLVLAVAIFARYGRHLVGAWSWIYAVSAVVALYFNVFVLIVQAFLKVPALKPLAPTQSEPPFQVTQLLVLGFFVALAVVSAIRFRSEPVRAA